MGAIGRGSRSGSVQTRGGSGDHRDLFFFLPTDLFGDGLRNIFGVIALKELGMSQVWLPERF